MRPRNFLCQFLLVAGLIPAAAETGRLDKTGFRARDGGRTRNFAVVPEGGTTVLYELGRGRTAAGRRVVTTGVLVRLKDPGGAVKLAETAGASSWRKAPALADGVILEFAGRSSDVLTVVETLRTLPQVLAADPLLARQQVKRWIPNDPLFGYNPASAGYQWHLNNTGQNGGTAGVDIHVTAVWDHWKGEGIRIGIVDDGLQTAHPDLAANVDTAIDYDWNGHDSDPSPGAADVHGTCCAGVAAARGNNGAGVCGAAPEATLVGLRLIAFGSTDETESQSLLHRNDVIQIKSNSWGPDDDGTTVEGPDTMTAAALGEATASGRSGLGTIVCWAAGNGRDSGDDSNYDGYANSIHVLAIAAVTDSGAQPFYSESGANLLISAPASGGGQSISTTDLTGVAGYNSGAGGNYSSGDYTNGFSGTSAACPLAAGGLALLLQSNPVLGWRDVKEILIRSAVKNQAADPGWFNNAAGFHFNDKFGAGMLNVQGAVAMAADWDNLGPMVVRTLASPGPVAIPDNSTAGAVKSFVVPAANDIRVEQVAVSVQITHGHRGQLEVFLTAPSGTVSRLARPRPDFGANLDWTFTTPQFWGESAQGTWTLEVRDTAPGTPGILTAASLSLYGTGSSPPITDADGDGFPADLESWFGTSDNDASSGPVPVLGMASGIPTISFPSLAGNPYTVDASSNLLDWTPFPLVGTPGHTFWTDPGAASLGRRYYRVRKP